MKKKIILTVTNDLEFDQRMHRICRSLHQAGYDVLLAGRELSISGALARKEYKQQRIRCLFNKGPLFYLEYNFRLAILLLKLRPDTINSADLDTLPAGWFASRFSKAALVYDAHEYFPESPELEGRRFKKRLWYMAESFLVPRVAAAYTVSPAIQDLFHSKYKTRFELIRNLPQYSVRQHSASTGVGTRYMIYQGALNTGRGLEAIILAMPGIDLELWIAGEGDLSAQLRELAGKTAPGKVKFLGRVDTRELKKITAGAVLGLNLLEPMGISYKYSLSNKFFDYIMAEIPQVCIAFQEYRKINKRYEVALLVDDLDEGNLVRCIEELSNDAGIREKLISNCRRAKEEFNWDKEAGKLLEIYNSL